ncbi:hypothetical protein V7x_17450 [Crateriforma conspicua]|uniref:Uncharacterized protein n=1 Tax=Crateriforma conspicua TaxID=2527996 RepID=A0A5C6FT67_9PLAN|nr:hypothetical protein V7x_17450 [Crateriforma conspicua]
MFKNLANHSLLVFARLATETKSSAPALAPQIIIDSQSTNRFIATRVCYVSELVHMRSIPSQKVTASGFA